METAHLGVHNDITLNMGNGKVTALILLELTAGFDTINHTSLMDHFSFGTVTFYSVHNPLSSVINRHHLWHHLYADDRNRGWCYFAMFFNEYLLKIWTCHVQKCKCLTGSLILTLYKPSGRYAP